MEVQIGIDKKEQNRINQRTFYEKNKDSIRDYKRKWYEENKEKANERNRVWRKKKFEQDNKPPEATLRKEKTLYDVIDVLRKNMQYYLWNKCIKQWNQKDWINFKNLENDIRI